MKICWETGAIVYMESDRGDAQYSVARRLSGHHSQWNQTPIMGHPACGIGTLTDKLLPYSIHCTFVFLVH